MGVYVCVCDGASEGENGGVKDALRYFNYLPWLHLISGN